MRPSGTRQRAVVTYLSPAEAQALEAARLLDGGPQALPRSAWLIARAVERLQTHAAAGERLAAAALAALRLERRLCGAARDGAKPAKARLFVAAHLDGLAELAARREDAQAEAEARAALAALRTPSLAEPDRNSHSTMPPPLHAAETLLPADPAHRRATGRSAPGGRCTAGPYR